MFSKTEIRTATVILIAATALIGSQKIMATEKQKLNTFAVQQQEPSLGNVYEVKTQKDRPKIKGCKNPVWLFESERVFEARCKNGKKVFVVGKKD